MYRADGSPLRVLLVDDEKALTNLVRMALQYEGWQIEVAHDANEALAKYGACDPTSSYSTSCFPTATGWICSSSSGSRAVKRPPCSSLPAIPSRTR
jgi:PleD family two-component response regulator